MINSADIHLSLIALLVTVLAAGPAYTQQNETPGFADFPPDDVTHYMDRNQMMAQLGISFLSLPAKLDDPNRPPDAYPADASNPEGNWVNDKGYTVTRSGFGLWVTYDDNVGDYTPIDLLTMHDGTRITTAEQWWSQRRPEVVQDVQEQIWGVMPDADLLPAVTWEVKETTGGEGELAYIEKTITGHIDTSRYPQVRDVPKIESRLRLPANATGPVPVIVMFGGRRGLDAVWELAAPHGLGLCTLNPNALQPDNGTGLTSYLIGLVNQGNWRKPNDWGTLVAWSWGVSKLIDYFETDDRVDATKVGITGHSRFGKASLVAIAYEPRLAIAFPSCGGALGPSMIRRHWGQDLESIAWDGEYHWVAGNFFKWMGPLHEGQYMPRKVELLPVDAHSLLALAAPRPVFLNAGTYDTWPDPYGIYLTAAGATPVYELLGREGLIMPDDTPQVDAAYTQGTLGYRLHDGGHTPMPDWPAFIEFAKRHFEE